jgi:SAM-dependent methyltransferase
MKKWLHDKLICPDCLPAEIPLELNIEADSPDEVEEGSLTCQECRRSFSIHEGIAVLLPLESMDLLSDSSGYNSQAMLSSYLWSHYCDFLNDPDATDAYRIWASFLKDTDGYALDIGCSVGRLSFEMTRTHSRVIGLDTSISFIRQARELMQKRRLDFELIIEGLITEKRSCEFDSIFNFENIDFMVADALALPFSRTLFSTVTSINLLEKVPDPMGHLVHIDRVLRKTKSMFMFSDPFSWDASVSEPGLWIGGKPYGQNNGRGMDNIQRLFSGEDGIFDPPLKVMEQRDVPWKIRKTENLWEHINSQFIVGVRE